MRKQSPTMRALLGGLLAGIAVLAVLVDLGARSDFPARAAYAGTPVVPPRFATDATLVDGSGRPAHLFEPDDAATFLFFGYTHCPDSCPLAMASLGRAERSLAPAVAARTRIVFVTVDPKRDTPPVIARYTASFGSHIVGLTGSPNALAGVRQAYGVTVDPATKEIGHGDAIYAIDHTQHVVLVYPSDATWRELAADATQLASR